MKFSLSVLVLILAGPLLAIANDGFGPLGVGGVVIGKKNDIAMRREVLDISYRQIKVHYEFVNESDHNIESIVTFPLPKYDAWPSQSGIVNRGQPPEFEVAVDGKLVRFNTIVRATLGARDVTSTLRSVGLTDRQLVNMPFELDKNLSNPEPILSVMSAEQVEKLKKIGLVDDVPLWSLTVAYQWRQTFPARDTVIIEHKYRPFVAVGTASGYSRAYPDQVNRIAKQYCMDQASLAMLDKIGRQAENLDAYSEVPGTIVDYVLMTANTWKDGIREFTLRLHKQSPREIISLCFPGQFKKIDALTIETRLSNFHPSTDLQIYFGNARAVELTKNVAPEITVAR